MSEIPITTAGTTLDDYHATTDVEAQNKAIAEAALAPASPAPPALPSGVTPDHIAALVAAGYAVNVTPEAETPAPASPQAPQVSDGQPAAQPNEAQPGLDELRQDSQGAPTLSESITQYSNEWFTNGGSLSEDTRAILRERHNADDEALDQFMGAIARKSGEQLLADAGVSISDFTSWEAWSAKNEAENDREARWELLRSTNPSIRKMGIDALKTAYESSPTATTAPGQEPTLVRGNVQTSNEAKGEIYREAARSPLYNKIGPEGDAYRAQVDQRLLRAK